MKQFVKLLILLGESEIDIELSRQELSAQNLFEPFTVFKRLDQYDKEKLHIHELNEFLKDNTNTTYSKFQLEQLFQYLDYDNDGSISYNDFVKTILPQDHSDLAELAILRSSYQIDKNVLLPSEIENLLKELFLCILTWCETIYQTKIQITHNDQRYILDYLFKQQEKINIQQFYQIINQIQPVKPQTLLSCFKKLDKTQSKLIQRDDIIQNLFKKSLVPQICVDPKTNRFNTISCMERSLSPKSMFGKSLSPQSIQNIQPLSTRNLQQGKIYKITSPRNIQLKKFTL